MNEEMEPKQNNPQLWMWQVIEAKSDDVKNNISKEPGMLGQWIKADWKRSNRRWQESVHQYSHSVVSDSLWTHGLEHTRVPCTSPTPGVYPNSCLLSRWCHPTISSSLIPFSSCLQSFPSIRVFSNESVLCIRWPKYWSFSFNISPFNEHSGLISFRMD